METTQKKLVGGEDISKEEYLFREAFVFVLDLIQFTELLQKEAKYSLAEKIFVLGTDLGKMINQTRFASQKNTIRLIKKMRPKIQDVRYLLQLSLYSETYPNPNKLISDLDKLVVLINGLK